MAQKFDNISFPGWEVVRKLGEGSFGGVYEIQRTLPDGTVERAALKKLTVPKDQAEITELYAQSYDSESITAHFKERMQDLVREYSFMQKLGENPNVVHCQDLRTVQHDDGIGWDIYIRMELLTPLKLWLKDRYDERQVIRLGLNMCGALHGCHQRNIIHRDIKPENILVNEEGRFKLGDFGIAKVSEKTATGTLTGTYSYMAPEIANRQHYGASADIYSLGLVMYWMMNERTLPFLPLGKKIPSGVQRQEAQDRRFSGEAIPAPINGSPELTRIVLKACAFDPKERYHTVQELAGDLKRHYQTIRAGKKSPANPIPAENRKPNTNVMEELGVTPEMLTDYPSRNSRSISRRETVSNNRGYYDASFREPSSGMDKRPPSKPMRDPKGRETGPNMKKWIFCSVVVCAMLAFFFAGGYLLWTSYTNLQERNRQAAAYAEAYELEETGRIAEAAMAYYQLGERERSLALWDEAAVRDSISAGYDHTVSIKADGTVVAVGNNEDGQCNTSAWKDIAAISTGTFHTLGLKSDGTVVGVGNYMDNRRKVGDWKDIVAISAGTYHTVGLKADGTVVAAGSNYYGQCDVSSWTDIVAISAGYYHTVGLKADGTVVAVGSNYYGQCDVSSWTDIVAISAGYYHTVGLKADGSVVAVGDNEYGKCEVNNWKDIIAISAGNRHSIGLKSDGTVVAIGDNEDDQCSVDEWSDIVAVSTGNGHTVGMKADGSVVAVGRNDFGQCNVSNWNNIQLPAISQERWDKLDAATDSFASSERDTNLADSDRKRIGISLPTQDLKRWNQDGASMETQLKEVGYDIELLYAANDISTQISQIETMIDDNCDLLVIAAIDCSSLSTVLTHAKKAGIPVIAYDRLILNSDAVSYYVTFDNWLVGVKQGEYIRDALDLDNAKRSFTIEFITGDPSDNNIHFFYDGAMSILTPYLESGKLVCPSGQIEKVAVATANWATDAAQARFETILSSYYADGTQLDAVLCSNDSTSLGVQNALKANYTGEWPVLTGQDCDVLSTISMLEGTQSMSVFRDTRILTDQVVKMIDALMRGAEPEINDTYTYDNGTGVIPSYLCEPIACTPDMIQELLVDSGYYTAAELGL